MSFANQKLVDYFVISGLNISSGLEPDKLSGDNLHCSPLDRSYKSHILVHYPESVPGNPFDAEAVCMLCYPRGLTFRTQRDDRDPMFHSFLITKEDGTHAYGAALTFYEEVENKEICSAMQTLQSMHTTELSNAQSRTLQAHLSPSHSHSSPKHNPTDEILAGKEYDEIKDTLYSTKCLAFVSRLPLVWTFEQFLQSLYDAAMRNEAPDLPIGSYIYNIIHEVPLLPPGRSMRLSTCNGPIVCQRPGTTELPLLDFSLREIFVLLTIDNVLSIFRSVLLEHQILYFSRDFQKLMLIAEGISALLFPFHWQHVYVPILPASLLHFLDAPVPYIMGLQGTGSKSLFEACSKANMCLVDIDSGTVEIPEDLPAFPYMSELRHDLLQELRRQSTIDDKNTHQRDSGFVRDSFVGADSAIGSADSSSLSLTWSISDKMEMLQQNEALARVMALTRKSGVTPSLDDIRDSLSDTAISANRARISAARAALDDHVKDLMFNGAIREIFLHYFLYIFGSYEVFVILTTAQDMESWINNREMMQNFDKTAFLSDHAEEHLHFLSPFTETQMFTSFIDSKILSQWEDPDANLAVFECRLKAFKDDQTDQRLRKFFRTAAAKEAESIIEKRASIVDIISPIPKHLEDDPSFYHRQHFFPTLSSAVLNKEPTSNRTRSSQWRMKYGLSARGTEQKLSFDQREKYIQEVRTKGSHQPNLSDMNLKSMVNTNLKFMDTLLKECKAKTKRMLVQKMGQEAVDLGHGEVTVVGVEEKTLIASLCDLLERIWNHGLQQKQGKLALWSHLVNYNIDSVQKDQENKPVDPNNHVPTDLSVSGVAVEVSGSCPSGTQTWPMRRQHRRKPSRGPELPALEPLIISVLADMRNIQQMIEIKTDVGYARAFVKLALEKKLLSKHLKELLSNQDLLRSSYKRYAFLRCEDEREQFLYHLLSLNAVDYFCFTNTFTTTVIVYRILVFPRLKLSGGTTTANCWLSIAGQFGETDKLPLPKHMLDINVKHKNLGILTTMRIGHDNGGISPKWMVEHVLVRNEVTGHTYRFPCGRWLGKGADDGALERLLVAEPVPPTVDANELMEKCRTPPRCRSPSMPRKSNEPRLMVSEIQEKLSDVVNNLVKHFCKPEKERGSVTGLLCGEYGLVYCMEHVFQYGFKSSRLFRNRVFIWDFLEKVLSYLESLLGDTEHYQIAPEISTTMQSFCYVVSCINQASESIGKDGRFQIFICIGIRDRLIQRWMKLISKTPVTSSMYEEQSFLRDPSLVQFIIQILDSLKEFQIPLEASLIKGVNL